MNGKWIRVALLAMAASAMLGQDESEPYFSLSSFRTFAPKAKPTVSLSAYGINTLEFRVYRVNDAEKFFTQLEDPHQFGGRARRPPREQTALERLRRWKRSLRAEIRRSLRGQFTESPSAHMFPRSKEAAPVTPANRTTATRYAEVPVLNSQQLVMTFTRPMRGLSRWNTQEVEVPVNESGTYLVEAVNRDLRAYTILMVSDLAMITKVGRGRIVNFVVDRMSGQPVAQVKVSALSRQGEVASATTDESGIAEIKTTPPSETTLTVFARKGPSVAATTVSGGSYGPNGEQWSGYVYTDRPVYRPGHTVHFKAIMRTASVSGYEVPSGRKVSVEVRDSDDKPIYQKSLTIGATGNIHDELALPATASLGSYSIQIEAGENDRMSGNFDVEEYKKPEYQVRVTPGKARVIQGETIDALIDARYFFGEPVAGAKVKYAIYRDAYWFPIWGEPDNEDEPSTAQDGNDDFGSGDQTEEKEGELDADGKLAISVPTTLAKSKGDQRYRIEARVTDAANREISGTGWVVATYGSFSINIQPDRYMFTPGGKATFTVQARDYDNHPVNTRVQLDLRRWDYRRGRMIQSDSRTTMVETGADGSGKAAIDLPQQGGGYEVRATTRTPESRDIEDISFVWVEGGNWPFDSAREQSVQIISDQKTYKAGDVAKLMIVAGQPNTAVYVTVEGRDVRQTKYIKTQESTASFDLKLTANDEPGVTVMATFLRDGMMHTGTKYVRVPPAEHQLNVKMTTDKPQYLPGQNAEYSLEVTGVDGKPVPRAEVSLGVVDEAIYGIRPDLTPGILPFFFGRQYNRVSTESSLEYYFNGEAGKRRMQLASLRPRSKLAQLKPERLVEPKVRKAFPDTAFWLADITTDATGHARAKVEFPDSLTTWRATARGVTADTKVGSAVLKTIVRKSLILRLAVPRFFVQGDEVVISALVHNYLDQAKTARVSLEAKGLEFLEGATKDVMIPSRGEAKIDWRVRAQQVHSVTITGKALTNEESDALELQLPVNTPGVKLGLSKGGSIAAGAVAAFDITYPDKVEAGSRSLSIRISPSVAGSLFGALDYLTSFPYGCVEQTMSSFLPNIVVKDAVSSLKLKVDLDEASLQQKIRAGLDRLYSFQHEDGGWGWWQTDESHPFMTAYVVAGLVQARTAGVPINSDAVTKGAAWLKKTDAGLAPDLRAYIAYALALAGEPDAKALGDLYSRRTNLSPYGMAILGLALEQAKDARATSMASALEAAVEQSAQEAWWTASRDPMLDFSGDVTPEATAFAAKLLSHQRKDSPLLPKAAQWLMNHRNEGYWWASTKQTAMVIYGLTDYLKVTNELMPDMTATVFVNDAPVLTRKIDQATSLNPPDLVLDESKLQPGMNRIRVTSNGTGRLYYSVRGEYFSKDTKLEKTGTVALNILRDYFRLTPTRTGDRIVYDTVPLDGSVTAGDVLAVRLTVTGSDWNYLLVEDPIPAGTEFIEKDSLYELRNRPSWWSYYFTRRELHDDRMAIFQTHFAKGQQQYFYLLKVVNPGAFQVSPARVVPMYQPEVMATTESRRLEAK